MYLVARELLDQPILYLSAYIIDMKADYYQLLQETRVDGDWEPWLLINLFRHPYTTIEAVQNDLGVSRLTASKYLTELTN